MTGRGRLLTLHEVAVALGVSETRVYYALSTTNSVQPTTLRGRLAIREDDVAALREAMEQ